jgi:hypothetical protein
VVQIGPTAAAVRPREVIVDQLIPSLLGLCWPQILSLVPTIRFSSVVKGVA